MSDSEEEESPDRQLKLVVLGDGTTGKVSAGPAGAPLPRRGAPSRFPALPLTLSLTLLLRREQPAAGSRLSRSRCRDTWAGCSPSAPGPARDTRVLPAGIRAVPSDGASSPEEVSSTDRHTRL